MMTEIPSSRRRITKKFLFKVSCIGSGSKDIRSFVVSTLNRAYKIMEKVTCFNSPFPLSLGMSEVVVP